MVIAIAREVGGRTRGATGCRAIEAVGGRRDGMDFRGWRGLGLTGHRCVDGGSVETERKSRVRRALACLSLVSASLNHPL